MKVQSRELVEMQYPVDKAAVGSNELFDSKIDYMNERPTPMSSPKS